LVFFGSNRSAGLAMAKNSFNLEHPFCFLWWVL
jgi:hypothetical protein